MLPTVLPDNAWGLGGLALIFFGSAALKWVFGEGAKKDTEENTADNRVQVLVDTFTLQLTRVEAEMEDGFRERDIRISDLERTIAVVDGKYRVSLRHIRTLRRALPEGAVPIPPEISDDL